MTYKHLFELKFKKRIPTHELGKRYPKEIRKISRIALLELSSKELLELVKREKELQQLLSLKANLLPETVSRTD